MPRRRLLEWVDAIIVISATALVAGSQQRQFRWFWDSDIVRDKPYTSLILTTVAGFFGVFQPFRNITERRRRPLRSVWDRHLQAALGDLITICHEFTFSSVDLIFHPGDIGLHVWRVRWRFRRSWIFFGRELVRMKTIRLSAAPALRNIRFYRGKGVVGRCWQLNDEVISDNMARYSSVTCLADWQELPRAERDKFTYDEFIRVKDRGAILASPIRKSSGTRFIGCVSVDLKSGVSMLESDKFRNRVQQLCIGIGGSHFEGLE